MANYKNKSYEINNNNIYKWRKTEWKFENKFKETKENLDDFSEKVKVKVEAVTEVLINFYIIFIYY